MPSYSIYRRHKDGEPVGNWLARAYLGGPDYREEFTTLETTDKAKAEIRAARWYAGLLEEVRDQPAPSAPDSLDAVVAEYKATDRYKRLAESTRMNYTRAWTILSERLGGETPIGSITDDDLRRVKRELLGEYAVNSVRVYFGAPYSRLFKYAVAKGWIGKNPLDLVETPGLERTPSHERDMFTGEQMDRLLDAAPDARFRKLWAIYRWTGCRTAEGLNIDRSHVHKGDGWLFIDGTKNANAQRTLPILPPLADYLKRLPTSGPLFDLDNSYANLRLRETGKGLGITPAYPKMFRRAFITAMRRQTRVPGVVWRRWVGHGSDQMARDHYDVQDLDYEARIAADLFTS